MLVIDLLAHRGAHAIGFKEAAWWSALRVGLSLVFALIFGYFKVPRAYQHRVLFVGVIGALVFRGIFLAAGVAIVNQFTAVLFAFAAVLLYSAYMLIKDDDDTYDPGTSVAVPLRRRSSGSSSRSASTTQRPARRASAR
jgi:tellurite resistance protein TerC